MEIFGEFNLLKQFTAFIGSLMYIAWLVKKFKDQRDTGKTRVTFKKYFSRNWDDFALIVFFGQALTFLQEFLFSTYAHYKEDQESLWGFYYDSEEAISFFIGIFGVMLFSKILKLGTKKLDDK